MYVFTKLRGLTKVASALVVSDRFHYFSIYLQPQHLAKRVYSVLTNVYCSIAIEWVLISILEEG